MKKILGSLALILAMVTLLAGCGGRVRYPNYYTLNLPSPPDPPARDGVRSSIAVREFQSPAYLRQGPIVYRKTPEQIGFYEYHRWAADPRMVVTGAVINHLRASGQYSMVSAYGGHADHEYLFSGRLENLEEVDYDSGVKVQVAMSAQITRAGTGDTVWSNAVTQQRSVSQRDVPGVVSEMNRTMQAAIDKLLATVPSSLENKR